MFSSFYPSHLNSFGWFPGREGGHNDNTLCRRWSDSHTQLGVLNWRVWVASGSPLCNFTVHNLKSACLGPNFLLIKKGKEVFEAKDCFIMPTWINGHVFSKSHGKKTLGEPPRLPCPPRLYLFATWRLLSHSLMRCAGELTHKTKTNIFLNNVSVDFQENKALFPPSWVCFPFKKYSFTSFP